MSLLLALTAGGGPAAVTGTAAWTEGDDTAVASGAVQVTATIVVLEGDDTAIGAASYGPRATIAFTEGDDTIAATGAVQVTATIVVLEGDDTIAATGTGGTTPEADTGSHTGYDYIVPKPRRPLRVPTPKPPPTVVGLVRITETDDGIDAVGFTSMSLSDNDFEMLLLLQLV